MPRLKPRKTNVRRGGPVRGQAHPSRKTNRGRTTSAAARKRNAARKLSKAITKKAPPGRAKKSRYTR